MTHLSFKLAVNSFLDEVGDMVRDKNDDYAGDSDNAFEAFDQAAEVLGLTREQVWAVFYMKHVQAVMRWINTGELSSEGIRERLIDLAAYPAILAASVEEKKSG